MVRVTGAPASRKRRKRILKRARGFFGDRKNHIRQSSNAVMSALSFNYAHRKLKKRDFRSLWIQRIGVGAKMGGISYSKLINGLQKANCELNRKMLSEMAIHDPAGFQCVVEKAKKALA
ncbi:MAG: 50S ribosomal protein L20 [Chlamydiales bacterium]|nr:50S ribosomal protein L20 [Chlamydiales bacterium]MCH9634971.1 50S ribosomal protein L20 [Chlamydiales bacterium]MCH9704430.1 50S ribosomal protein L20 [Chlamydiota bacterium]